MGYDGKSLDEVSADFQFDARMNVRAFDGVDLTPKIFWLSYSFAGKFFGAVIVIAEGDEFTAIRKAHEMKIDVGGNISPRVLPDSLPADKLRKAGFIDRFLKLDDCIAFDEWCEKNGFTE